MMIQSCQLIKISYGPTSKAITWANNLKLLNNLNHSYKSTITRVCDVLIKRTYLAVEKKQASVVGLYLWTKIVVDVISRHVQGAVRWWSIRGCASFAFWREGPWWCLMSSLTRSSYRWIALVWAEMVVSSLLLYQSLWLYPIGWELVTRSSLCRTGSCRCQTEEVRLLQRQRFEKAPSPTPWGLRRWDLVKIEVSEARDLRLRRVVTDGKPCKSKPSSRISDTSPFWLHLASIETRKSPAFSGSGIKERSESNASVLLRSWFWWFGADLFERLNLFPNGTAVAK